MTQVRIPETCGHCKWWRGRWAGYELGHCRESPPTVRDRDNRLVLPLVHKDYYCGKFARRDYAIDELRELVASLELEASGDEAVTERRRANLVSAEDTNEGAEY